MEVCGALERRASRPDRPLLGALACDPASTYPGAGTLLVPCLLATSLGAGTLPLPC